MSWSAAAATAVASVRAVSKLCEAAFGRPRFRGDAVAIGDWTSSTVAEVDVRREPDLSNRPGPLSVMAALFAWALVERRRRPPASASGWLLLEPGMTSIL